MTVPGRVDAAALLLSLDPPNWFVAHSRAVAEVAAFLASRIEANGIPVDRAVVEAAALLHDVDKVLPQDDPASRLSHGHGSAAWLAARGHEELARAVANHPVKRLADGEEHRRWAAFASREERVVAYADKRAKERLVPMDDAVRDLAATPPRALGRCDHAGRSRPSRSTGGRRLPGRRHRARRGPAVGVDDRCPSGGRRLAVARPMIPPLLYVWGDDELVAERLVGRFATALAGELGAPLERWDLRGDLATAATGAAQLHERLATAVLFGGGTLAVVSNPGALVRAERHARPRARGDRDARQPATRSPSSRRRSRAPRGRARNASSTRSRPRAARCGRRWRRDRPGSGRGSRARRATEGWRLAPAPRVHWPIDSGSRVTEGDVDRRYLSRIASGELDKLALRHAIDGGPVTADDVQALVAETTPGSVWALTDAVGERRTEAALVALDRLIDTTPEPVLLAVLHRRVVELLELGDRLAGGAALPAAAKAMGIASEYRAKTLAGQARNWTTAELTARPGGPRGARCDGEGSSRFRGGCGATPIGVHDVGPRSRDSKRPRRGAARRPRLTPGPDTAFRPSVGGRPGLFLDDEIALDREDAAALAQVEEFDQLGIDVQLRAVLAQSAGDAEAQPLTPVGQPEGRVEPGRDEPVATGRTAFAERTWPDAVMRHRTPS